MKKTHGVRWTCAVCAGYGIGGDFATEFCVKRHQLNGTCEKLRAKHLDRLAAGDAAEA